MDQEILPFDEIEIQKKITPIEVLFFKRMSFKRFLLVKKTINTLLVSCIMIIKLNHFI